MLDAVREEASSLRGHLAVSDRDRLEQYLDGVRALETRISRYEKRLVLEAADAADPGPSRLVMPNLPDKKIPFYQIEQGIGSDPEKHAEYIRIMSDIMVLAFQTDTTRVVTLAVGSDGAYFPGVW